MTEPEEQPSREDAFYSLVRGFLERHGLEVALVAPWAILWLVPEENGGVVVLLVIYLVELIAYVWIRFRRWIDSGGARSGPGCLPMLLGVLGSVLIVGGSFGLAFADESPSMVPGVALALGFAIFAWGWHRVSRTSGEATSVFAARIAGSIGSGFASAAVRLILGGGLLWLILANAGN